MRTFAEYNPIAVAVYFLAVAAIPMFSMNPVILLLSFIGAVLLYFIRNGMKNGRTHMYSLLLFIVMALINPLVSHNGVTVLFVMNDNPVTLEALIYGIAASAMIISVLYWFRSFSQIMTGERLLYVFCALSPKLALVLSMALRYVPLFGSQTKKINHGVMSGIVFSFVMDIWTVLWYSSSLNWKLYFSAIITAIPHTVLYAVSNFLFLWYMGKPIGEKLERVKVKYLY